jgi:hypothetical protein
MSIFDQLIRRRPDFEVTEFADLSYSCSPAESGFLTGLTFALAVAPVVVVFAFALS